MSLLFRSSSRYSWYSLSYHVRQSFRPSEITLEEANRLGVEFARRFLKGNNAFIVCTHIDKSHVHNHIIWNSTTLDCSRKFRNFWGSTRAVRNLSDTICLENHLSIVENPKRHGKSYNKWLGDKAKPGHRELLRALIDGALEKKPADFDALLNLLQAQGVEVTRRGESISLKAPGRKSLARLDSLKEGYTEDDLTAILAGKKEHAPRKKAAVTQPQKTNLLIDIQAKLDAGKGAGCLGVPAKSQTLWGEEEQRSGRILGASAQRSRAEFATTRAKVFNLKQMAQTMNYLREHGLLDYGELKEKADAATGRFNALSAQIKAAETRMAEVAVLKTQIINYAKTREVFDSYKASRYSKKYLAEHEADILLHRAAKKTFNDLGLKKLPTVKSLQTEYAKLLSEKKSAYADYRQARDVMRELLTHRANVERILGDGAQTTEKEKEQEQR